MSDRLRWFRRDESGQTVILVAIMFLALMFALALAVNAAQLFVARRNAQTAADAAALAGAVSLSMGGSSTNAYAAAADVARLNGFSGLNTSAVSCAVSTRSSIPPCSGTNQDAFHVEVVITQSIAATLFSQWGPQSVTARAVAGTAPTPTQALFLGAGTNTSLDVGNKGTLKLCSAGTSTTCTSPGVAQVNSSDSTAAIHKGGNQAIITPAGTTLNLVGGTNSNWGSAIVNENQPTVTDPYAGLIKPRPVTGTNWCRRNDFNAISAPCGTYSANFNGCSGATVLLQPGQYTAGTTISGNCDWVLAPGIYIFLGGNAGITTNYGIRVEQADATNTLGLPAPFFTRVVGATSNDRRTAGDGLGECGTVGWAPCGVLLFFTYSTYPSATRSGQCATLNMSGNVDTHLQPEPAPSPWAGVLVYYDFYDSDGMCEDNQSSLLKFTGGATCACADGIIYAGRGTVSLSGKPAIQLSQLIVSVLTISSNSDLTIAAGNVVTKGVRGPPRLVE